MGFPGQQGPAGATGSQGAKSDKGDTGQQGPKGDKGDQGVTGAIGPQGDKGDTGTQGLKGDKGDQGVTGAIGPQGDKGDTGTQGLKGDNGDQGITGAIGLQGDKGDTGTQGLKGDEGAQGPTGATGATGSTGGAGAAGPMGPAGPVGPGFSFRGEWDAAVFYQTNDVVVLAGSAFVARADSMATTPGTEPTAWSLVVSKGDKGDKGDTGTAGLTGVQGPQGSAGPMGPTGPAGPGGVATGGGLTLNHAVSTACTNAFSQPLAVPATSGGGRIVVTGWMRIVVVHNVGGLDRGFVYPSASAGADCGTNDTARSYWRVGMSSPADTHEFTVPIHQVFNVGTSAATYTIFFNSRMLNPSSGGSHTGAAANIDVMFVPN